MRIFARSLKVFSSLISSGSIHTATLQRLRASSQSLSSMSELLVGVCQMTSTGDIEKNIETCKKLIRRAKERGAMVVFLPEAFDYIAENKDMAISQAHTVDGPIIKSLSQLAKDSSSVEDSRTYNTHLILDNNGNISAKYHKLHLFDVDVKGGVHLMESKGCIPGKELPPVVKTPVGNIGLAVCYDLRFPELSLILTQQGADILSYPSAFTFTTGAAHWEILLRARAIETQCYVIAAAQTGQHNAKRRSYGRAMVVDPWGQVIAQCSEGEDVCVASIDLDYLKRIRTQMPVWNHRRTDIYGKIGPSKI